MIKSARNTYQNGCLQRETRKKGPDLWVFRYREDGNLKYRVMGTVLQYKTKTAAQLALGDAKANLNNRLDGAKFGDLCDRYLREGMPERHATASALRSMVTYRIKPYWAEVLVAEMAADPMSVEQWIKNLHTTPRTKDEKPRPLAPKSKAHTKAVFHRLFECAMRWRYLTIQRNPMSLIEIPGGIEARSQDRIGVGGEVPEAVAEGAAPLPRHGDVSDVPWASGQRNPGTSLGGR